MLFKAFFQTSQTWTCYLLILFLIFIGLQSPGATGQRWICLCLSCSLLGHWTGGCHQDGMVLERTLLQTKLYQEFGYNFF